MNPGNTWKQPTLCWNCAHATDGLYCEWVNGNAVPGWTVIPTKLNDNVNEREVVDSCIVLDCPKYKEEKRHISNRQASDEMIGKLITAVVNRAIRDWKKADRAEKGKRVWTDSSIDPKALKDDVEHFFAGNFFGCLCDIDGKKIIQKLKRGEI